MKRILVIGCSGAGKSTFARKLKELTGLPLIHLDMIWHRADKTTISREEFDRRLDVLLAEDEWIIDGNYARTLEVRLKRCDTVFLLDYPLEVCLAGVESRIGKSREDMPWVESEFDAEFREWIERFPQEKLPGIYQLLDAYREGRKIVILKSREAAERCLEQLWN